MDTGRNGDTEPAPPLDLLEQDYDELTLPDAGVSNWDRVFRMLRNITNKLVAVDQTQIKQLDVARAVNVRLDAIELQLKGKS